MLRPVRGRHHWSVASAHSSGWMAAGRCTIDVADGLVRPATLRNALFPMMGIHQEIAWAAAPGSRRRLRESSGGGISEWPLIAAGQAGPPRRGAAQPRGALEVGVSAALLAPPPNGLELS